MSMDQLIGTINRNSGEVILRCKSKFIFSIGSMLKFRELIINTLLTIWKVKGKLHSVRGQIIQNYGQTKLLGV